MADVCQTITDGSHYSPATKDEGFSYVTVRDLNEGEIDFTNCKLVGAADYADLKRNGCAPRQGDVLFSKDGTVGKVALVETDREFVVLSSLAILRPDPSQINSRFLAYSLQSPEFLAEALGRKTGVAIRRVILKNLKSMAVAVPSLPEQGRIVAVLDQAFAAIAAATANTEKNLANADALFQATLEAVFDGGDHWNERPLGEVCRFIGGSQPPKAVFATVEAENMVRLIQIRDYKSDRHKVFIPRQLARRFCAEDDVMIGRYGPPLFQILRGLEGAYNVALMKAAPSTDLVSKDFLYFFLRNAKLLRYIISASDRAAGQIGLTKETIEPYPIRFPNLEEQRSVVERLSATETKAVELSTLCKAKLKALEKLRQSILHQALSGQPTDREPLAA